MPGGARAAAAPKDATNMVTAAPLAGFLRLMPSNRAKTWRKAVTLQPLPRSPKGTAVSSSSFPAAAPCSWRAQALRRPPHAGIERVPAPHASVLQRGRQPWPPAP